MKQLSKAQRAALERLATGELVMMNRFGVDVSVFWKGMCHGRIHAGTFWSLLDRGYVADIKPDWRGGTYAITDKGRAALAPSPEQPTRDPATPTREE